MPDQRNDIVALQRFRKRARGNPFAKGIADGRDIIESHGITADDIIGQFWPPPLSISLLFCQAETEHEALRRSPLDRSRRSEPCRQAS
jgi:hypothetical protein